MGSALAFDDAVLGYGLPAAAEQALLDAGLSRGDPPRAMLALMRAQAMAPDHPAVLIALYRHHFFGHRLQLARDVARRALAMAALALGLPAVWRDVPRVALPGAAQDAGTRFFLFTLKGYACINLRMGDHAEAAQALSLLQALDPDDWVGAAHVETLRLQLLDAPTRCDPRLCESADDVWARQA